MGTAHDLRDFAASQLAARRGSGSDGDGGGDEAEAPVALADLARAWMARSGRVRGVAASDLGIALETMTRLLAGAPMRGEGTLRRLIVALDRLDDMEARVVAAVRIAVADARGDARGREA